MGGEEDRSYFKDRLLAKLFLRRMEFDPPESKQESLELIRTLSLETPDDRNLLKESFRLALRDTHKIWKKRIKAGKQASGIGIKGLQSSASSTLSMKDVTPGPGISLKNQGTEHCATLGEAIILKVREANRLD